MPRKSKRRRTQGDVRAARVRADLLTVGEVVPDPLRPTVFGADGAQSLVVESAEGITTFAGFEDDPGILARMQARVNALREELPPQDGSSPPVNGDDFGET